MFSKRFAFAFLLKYQLTLPLSSDKMNKISNALNLTAVTTKLSIVFGDRYPRKLAEAVKLLKHGFPRKGLGSQSSHHLKKTIARVLRFVTAKENLGKLSGSEWESPRPR